MNSTRAVASTENIDYVTSQSRPSSSTVTVQMKLGLIRQVAAHALHLRQYLVQRDVGIGAEFH
ncbi:efflux RND transporter permease subunit, partial [Mesorhizobium sp. M00.F.Ca.ET.216.01.1.1]|uniref:efflux RND transporter permease subunit n=1 Tax=Mesorhizobium sp. M00.F.Ca.ET.216.01.1.1 TaxID=2500528 RepID=UPI001AEEA9E1